MTFNPESFLRTLTSTASARQALADLEELPREESERLTSLQLQQLGESDGSRDSSILEWQIP